jgi:hypothetical protein
MNPKSQATHLWFAALTQPQCVTAIIIFPHMYCTLPHDVSEHVKIATFAHRWGGPLSNLLFAKHCHNLKILTTRATNCTYVSTFVGIRHSCVFCLQGACSKSDLKKSTVEPPCFRSWFEKNISYCNKPTACTMLLCSYRIWTSCLFATTVDVGIPHSFHRHTLVFIYLVPESFACRQYVYVQIKSR